MKGHFGAKKITFSLDVSVLTYKTIFIINIYKKNIYYAFISYILKFTEMYQSIENKIRNIVIALCPFIPSKMRKNRHLKERKHNYHINDLDNGSLSINT